jgi:hypothetical protein
MKTTRGIRTDKFAPAKVRMPAPRWGAYPGLAECGRSDGIQLVFHIPAYLDHGDRLAWRFIAAYGPMV